MKYTKGGNKERVFRMIEDHIPRSQMPAVSGLNCEQVKKAIGNLVFDGYIRKIEGTGGKPDHGRGKKGFEYEAIAKFEEKPVIVPSQMICSVWDLARV